jgi:hypothetical protein
MDVDEALAMGMEFAPGDGRGPEALHALAAEVERLREVVAGDGARIFALQARVIVLEKIEERAKLQAAHALQDEDRNLARIILGELDWDI